MPDEIKEILVGILLGDAHMARRSPTANCRLVCGQTAVKHKEYFEYVFSFFISFCTKDYKPVTKIINSKNSNKTYPSIYFTTMQLPCFNVFRELFYILNEKVVPENIYELLTPRGLAFGIMDDGSRQGDGLHIGVYGFKNIDKLLYTLENKFNLKCSIHYHNNRPRIYIFKESMDNLKTLVKPYFIKEMLYKLGE